MTYTTRCNAKERAAFNRKRPKNYQAKTHGWLGVQLGEPALGTVDERLSIILARLGKPVRRVTSGEDIEQYRVAA